MTNYRLSWYSGSDTYLYTLGVELMKRRHRVSIYSPFISYALQGRRFEEAGFTVLNKLEKRIDVIEKGYDFDIIHGQHNSAVSDVCNVLTKVPAIFVSHGVLPHPEKPPKDVLINKYIGVSEEVLDFQFKDIDNKRKEIIRNPIDTDRFYYSPKKIGKRLRILIVSNYFGNEWSGDEIWKAAKELNADVDVIGTNGRMIFATEKIIKDCDIAIGLGRSILEAMAMGKPVIVGDYNGYDGLMTKQSYEKIKKCNFSGRTKKEKWDSVKLVKTIKNLFKGDYVINGLENRDIILENHTVEKIADRFEEIYNEVLSI